MKHRSVTVYRNQMLQRLCYNQSAYIEDIDPEQVYLTYDARCAICRQELGQGYHLDHIFPIVQGGMHFYGNIQPLDRKCHDYKTWTVETNIYDTYRLGVRHDVRLSFDTMMASWWFGEDLPAPDPLAWLLEEVATLT